MTDVKLVLDAPAPPVDRSGVIVVAVLALAVIGRRRAAWLGVPGLWPATQWYYATLAVPGLTPTAAALMAIPAQGQDGLGQPLAEEMIGHGAVVHRVGSR
jgi:hypothetical protein